MQKAANFIQRTLLLWLTVSSLAAYFWPDMTGVESLDPFITTAPAIPYQFAVTMFCIGCLLPREEVDQLAKRWPTVLGGTSIQYITMPLLAWGIATVLGLEGPYRVGMIVVGCVPGAMASNVLTLAARGNVSYSVSLTTMATILSPFVVPLVLKLTLSGQHDVPTEKIMISLLWQVVAPVIAGHLICRSAPKFSEFMRGLGPIVANATIIWIIAVVVAQNRANLRIAFDGEAAAVTLLVGLLVLNILGYLAGFGGGSALGLPDGMRRALTLEIGMQNAGLGTSLVQQFFKEEPSAAIPPALYTFGCMVTGTLLAQWWSRKATPDDEAQQTATAKTTGAIESGDTA
ncbi:MAG: bile acid:sodium symporter family protein [Planctomycetota bacterium]|nr:bile acid:sodium symporter family protein [Planctomycetota bacterium]MDA1161493.1 bile acid:sodium symporter family protein [Planctomycetota bacterium]